jgi:hypothetical protein
MIAINSQGATKLSISYLIATVTLAITVWAIVQLSNTWQQSKDQQRFKKLEQEKMLAEERIRAQEEKMMKSKQMVDAANKINEVISQGTGYASNMRSVDVKDFSVELDVLVGRANAMKNKINTLVKQYESLREESSYFPDTRPTINEALNNLREAAKYYWLYFRAEDTAQEELRERIFRQKARKAYDLLKQASSNIASSL